MVDSFPAISPDLSPQQGNTAGEKGYQFSCLHLMTSENLCTIFHHQADISSSAE
jgi:hypothetical protein